MGVTKEPMAGIVLESWFACGLGTEGELEPSPREAGMLASHDAVPTDSRKTQQLVY